MARIALKKEHAKLSELTRTVQADPDAICHGDPLRIERVAFEASLWHHGGDESITKQIPNRFEFC